MSFVLCRAEDSDRFVKYEIDPFDSLSKRALSVANGGKLGDFELVPSFGTAIHLHLAPEDSKAGVLLGKA